VATLRSWNVTVLRTVLIVAAVADFGVVAIGEEAPRPTAPRTLMRLPRWIESLSEMSSRRINREPAAPTQPAAMSVTSPATARAPAAPAAATPMPLPPVDGTTPIETAVGAGTTTGESLEIASTPPESSEGLPGRALLRSRTPAPLDPHATLTSGWTDLVPGESPAAKPAGGIADAELVDSPPSGAKLGPEDSVLRRDDTAPSVEADDIQPAAAAPTTDAATAVTTAPIVSNPTEPNSTEPAAAESQPGTPQSAEQSAAEPARPSAPADADVEVAQAEAAAVTKEPLTVAASPAADEQPPAKPAPTTPQPSTTPADPVAPPVAATPEETPTLAIDPASFRGVHPGKTQFSEVEAGWGPGEAFTREDGAKGFFWKIEPFERVEVILDGDTVGAIRIKLAAPVAVAELAAQLEIADLRTVSILDEQGVSIGEVFPERGVIFSVKPGTQSATAVMLEPLDPESFVLRAEGEIDMSAAYAAADLQYAIEIDPKHLRATRLLLVLMCEQGRWQQALRLAEAAERLDPVDVWTRLKLAGVLLALDRPEEARAKVTAVKNEENVQPLVAAQAERLLGRIVLAENTPDYQKSVEHFAEAIRRATPLIASRSTSIQKAAREVLLESHLGTALAIAKGTWQQKSRVIPKWIARSEAIVNELKAAAEDRNALELQLCRGALAVAAGSSDSIEPLPWVKRLLEVRERMGEGMTDPWRRRQIDWEIGQGLSDALVAAQKRGDASDMLDNATLTAAYLERGAEHRELTPVERKNVGGLHFRIGILHSLQRGDHATAVSWFDKAVPLWEDNPAFDRDGETGQLGESLVSMAISYWQVERRDDAMKLSRRGVDLMVEAIDRKQLDERSLAVAYGNLSTMYAEQGDDEQAKNYAEMASRAEAVGARTR
jgi:tetratricopeptide (TPR) repeat protein